MTKRKRRACTQEATCEGKQRTLVKSLSYDGEVGPATPERVSISLLAEQYDLALPTVPEEIDDPQARKKLKQRRRKEAFPKPDFRTRIKKSKQPKGKGTELQEPRQSPKKIVAPWIASEAPLGSYVGNSAQVKDQPIMRSSPAASLHLDERPLLVSGAGSPAGAHAQHSLLSNSSRKTTPVDASLKHCNLVQAWSTTRLPARKPRQWYDESSHSNATHMGRQGECNEFSSLAPKSQARLGTVPSWEVDANPFRESSDQSETYNLSVDKSTTTDLQYGQMKTNFAKKATSVPTHFHVDSLERARLRLFPADDESEDGDMTSDSDVKSDSTGTHILHGSSSLLPEERNNPNELGVIPDGREEQSGDGDEQQTFPSQHLVNTVMDGRDQQPALPNTSRINGTIRHDRPLSPQHNTRILRSSSKKDTFSAKTSTECENNTTLTSPMLSPSTGDIGIDVVSDTIIGTVDGEVPETVSNKRRKATTSKSPHFTSQITRRTRHVVSQMQRTQDTKPKDDGISSCGSNNHAIIGKVSFGKDAIHGGLPVDTASPSKGITGLKDHTGIPAVDNAQHCDERSLPRLVRTRSRTTGAASDYFIPENVDRVDRPKRKGVTVVRTHPITDPAFGIIQEKTWSEPFWLLIAVKFLNVTRGRAAIPIFWELKAQYDSPETLALANQEHLMEMTRPLGLQRVRSIMMIQMAKAWIDRPPTRGIRFRTLHYPDKGNGKDLKKGSIAEDDTNVSDGALEIGGFPGCNRYAYDSWRIFCRDVCRGVAEDYKGTGADEEFQPEWQRVLPQDKELRAFLAWMWLREGWVWDYTTGDKYRATDEQMEKARLGTFGIEVEVTTTIDEKQIIGEHAVDSAEKDLVEHDPNLGKHVEHQAVIAVDHDMCEDRKIQVLDAVEIPSSV